MDIFNIKIEFDHDAFRQAIMNCRDRKEKGYVCVVDGNVISMAQENEEYRKIVRDSYINTCDGGSIAAMANRIYGTNFRALTGPQLFREYVERKDFKQLLLGNTEEKFNRIKAKVESNGLTCGHLSYMPVPFATIDEFDYEGIAKAVNEIGADIIWVSLGAPKQEQFMARLLPYIECGLMFGIGAAFNFYVGDNAEPKFQIGAMKFIWLDRIIREPKKQLRRVGKILKIYPKMYIEERARYRKQGSSVK